MFTPGRERKGIFNGGDCGGILPADLGDSEEQSSSIISERNKRIYAFQTSMGSTHFRTINEDLPVSWITLYF